jgi:hypothetical protein
LETQGIAADIGWLDNTCGTIFLTIVTFFNYVESIEYRSVAAPGAQYRGSGRSKLASRFTNALDQG